MILPALALIVGAGGAYALAAGLPAGDPSAQPPAAVQTLNDTAATPAPVNTDAPDITVNPCGATPVADTRTDVCATPDGTLAPVTEESPAPAPAPVQTLNETPAATPSPTPTPTLGTLPQRVCAPWMEPGWYGPDGNAQSCIWAMPNAGGTLELKACATEDSENCYWDATIRGNGQGRSFINIRGHVFFEEAGQ